MKVRWHCAGWTFHLSTIPASASPHPLSVACATTPSLLALLPRQARSEEEEEKAAEKCQQVQKAAVAAKKVSRSWDAYFSSFSKNMFAHMIPVHVLMIAGRTPFSDIFLCKGLGEFQQIQVHVGKVQRQHISISFFLACCNRYIRHAVVSLPLVVAAVRYCIRRRRADCYRHTLLFLLHIRLRFHSPEIAVGSGEGFFWRMYLLIFGMEWRCFSLKFSNSRTPLKCGYCTMMTFLVYSAGAEWFCDSRGFMIGRVH